MILGERSPQRRQNDPVYKRVLRLLKEAAQRKLHSNQNLKQKESTMATAKKKSTGSKAKQSSVKVRDMKPSKDAKGGAGSKFSPLAGSKSY